ncbi:MAG TPA: phosphate/phosphite/phosphonate ABC transporter substrate-binding protein [Methylomirabilota bacterium]|nr:phosphate/phosphite/phosphonate ABC transporter substrate-binding protein [Methylomirabilota bacterium]
MTRLWRLISLLGAALFLPEIACAGSLSVGSISASPVSETRKFASFARYLARQLHSEGIGQEKVVVAESIAAMAALMRAGQVDLYIDSLFPTLAVSRLTGSELLLRRWKNGSAEYQAVTFARKDGGIARLEDLKGKMIAFEEPYSSTGYFFPKLELLKRHLRLTAKMQSSDPVGADEVGYVFSRGDTNTVFWVLSGAVAAGAIDGDKYLRFAKSLDSFRVLNETGPFPRQLVSYRRDLPAKLVGKIRQILLAMPQTDEGAKVLKDFENTVKFDEIPAQTLERAAKLKRHLDAELPLQR